MSTQPNTAETLEDNDDHPFCDWCSEDMAHPDSDRSPSRASEHCEECGWSSCEEHSNNEGTCYNCGEKFVAAI